MSRNLLLWLCAALLWAALPASAQEIPDFSERTYTLYVPESYDEAQPAPLLLVLHGAGGSGERSRDWLGLDALAEEAGFIIAYPDGIGRNWDFGAGIPTTGGALAVDDVGFLVWLVEQIRETYAVDTERVFAVGMSNGALMAYRLACAAPETFSAVAGVAAPLYLPAAQNCDSTPVSVLFIHGTDDPILPWERVRLRNGQIVGLSAFETFAFWAQRNQCSSSPDDLQAEELPDNAPDDGSVVRHLALYDCAAGTEVHFYGVEGGGHTWPGRPFDVELELGPLNNDIDASQVILAWFAARPARQQDSE